MLNPQCLLCLVPDLYFFCKLETEPTIQNISRASSSRPGSQLLFHHQTYKRNNHAYQSRKVRWWFNESIWHIVTSINNLVRFCWKHSAMSLGRDMAATWGVTRNWYCYLNEFVKIAVFLWHLVSLLLTYNLGMVPQKGLRGKRFFLKDIESSTTQPALVQGPHNLTTYQDICLLS